MPNYPAQGVSQPRGTPLLIQNDSFLNFDWNQITTSQGQTKQFGWFPGGEYPMFDVVLNVKTQGGNRQSSQITNIVFSIKCRLNSSYYNGYYYPMYISPFIGYMKPGGISNNFLWYYGQFLGSQIKSTGSVKKDGSWYETTITFNKMDLPASQTTLPLCLTMNTSYDPRRRNSSQLFYSGNTGSPIVNGTSSSGYSFPNYVDGYYIDYRDIFYFNLTNIPIGSLEWIDRIRYDTSTGEMIVFTNEQVTRVECAYTRKYNEITEPIAKTEYTLIDDERAFKFEKDELNLLPATEYMLTFTPYSGEPEQEGIEFKLSFTMSSPIRVYMNDRFYNAKPFIYHDNKWNTLDSIYQDYNDSVTINKVGLQSISIGSDGQWKTILEDPYTPPAQNQD